MYSNIRYFGHSEHDTRPPAIEIYVIEISYIMLGNLSYYKASYSYCLVFVST